MKDFRPRLQRRFQRQQHFAKRYSPLYSRLFGLVGQWLERKPGLDAVADWLVEVSCQRSSFEVPLLLLAALHRDILTGEAATADLACYYPTAGGNRLAEGKDLERLLRNSIIKRQDVLANFIATATVQTNEVARGLCWLMPALWTGWRSFHLVELGAAAGLNLAADEQQYCLYKAGQGREPSVALCDLGRGRYGCFSVACVEDFFIPGPLVLTPMAKINILSRTGCDLAPCLLGSKAEERNLAAFVWGDQLERLQGLYNGIAALRALATEGRPIRLVSAHLPDDLDVFLHEDLAIADDAPVVLFNTYISTYLEDRGASLCPRLAAWARQKKQPLLWLQWETDWQGQARGLCPPEFGQVAWTADLWQEGRHYHWHLAWVHPHGTSVHWLPGAHAWLKFWQS